MRLAKTLRAMLALAAAAACSAHAQVVPVVGAASPIEEVQPEELADVFLGRRQSLPGVGRVTPVDAPEGSPEREAFYRQYAGKSPAQMRAYWAKLIFTGKGFPPREAPSIAAVKKIVAGNPSAIGYVDESDVDARVKSVQVQE